MPIHALRGALQRARLPLTLLFPLLLALPGAQAVTGSSGPAGSALAAQSVHHPAEVFGFEPGADYHLADLDQLHAYYRALAEASPRVALEEIGRSVRGEPLYLVYISSEENIRALPRWREISERLARAGDLSEEEARELAREGRAIVWIDTGLHSAEVATSQHAPLLAHHMATDEGDEARRIRDDVILLLMPMMNPDGHRIVVDWYRGVARTEFEFTGTPEVWHEYVGHDINRDWFMIRQEETRHIARQLYEVWYPQIVFNHHQQSPFPTRIFIPPFSDPLNPHIHPLVVRGVNLVGEHMAKRFEEHEMPGVVSGLTFTMWWNGGMRTAPYFHNQVGILSEVAHRYASPQYHDPEELPETITAGSRQLSMVEPSIYYANPWRGGWARLADAVEYHLVASMGTLDIASRLREDWLFNMYRMATQQIRDGAAGGPYAYVFPMDAQWDRGEAVELLNVLRRGGIEVHRATEPFEANGEAYPEGTYVAFTSQAFRAHLMDLMEPQEHPHREIYPGGPPEPPYGGLAGWTLPMQMAVEAVRVEEPFIAEVSAVEIVPLPDSRVAGTGGAGFLLPLRDNRSRTAVNRLQAEGERVFLWEGDGAGGPGLEPVGGFVVEAGTGTREMVTSTGRELGLDVTELAELPEAGLHLLERPALGMYMPWTANMDEGWTRYILHEHGFRPDTIRNEDLQAARLDHFDVIIFADQDAGSIRNGHALGSMPEDYVGGVGDAGAENLRAWVEAGGTLIAFDGAGDFAIEALGLPVRNATGDLSREELFIPGSLIRARFDGSHPVGFGMPEETAAFFQNSRAWEVLDSESVDVVGRYAESDLLMSGWELGAEEHLSGRPAVVRARVGEGEAVLIGFRPQFRAQATGTYRLFFNAIHGAGAVDRPALLGLRGAFGRALSPVED